MPTRLSREVRLALVPAADRGAEAASAPRSNGWAGWPLAERVGSFYTLRVWVDGDPDPLVGYLRDIRRLDELVLQLAAPPATIDPTLPPARVLLNLADKHRIQAERGNTNAHSVAGWELAVSPYLRYRIDPQRYPDMDITVTEQFEFSAAHRLHSRHLSDEENRQVFGKCNHPNGHGHNYVLDVTLGGRVDAKSGVLFPLHELERIVKERVIDRYDHKHLNLDLPEYAEVNPSVENIARLIFEALDGQFAPARLVAVRVYETAKTWAEYHA